MCVSGGIGRALDVFASVQVHVRADILPHSDGSLRSRLLGSAPAVETLLDRLDEVAALVIGQDTLDYMFKVLHHQQDLLPTPTYPLMGVAAVCHKHQLHRALQPVADKFFLPLGQSLSSFECRQDWLLTSYVFGYGDIFGKVSQYIILMNTREWPSRDFNINTPRLLILPEYQVHPISECYR
jgi:hypothetical protein